MVRVNVLKGVPTMVSPAEDAYSGIKMDVDTTGWGA